MLIAPDQIEIQLLNMGRGNGSLEVFRCHSLGFIRELRNDQSLKTRRAILEELDGIAFEKFRSGDFVFEPPAHQRAAQDLIELTDTDLIRNAYQETEFLPDFVIRELAYRRLFNQDLFRIGEFGGLSARAQAIELMLASAEQ